ncbi:hypothetical protein OEA41_001893 [Lepraria neglecta]|uniref:Uncharacterized protein n=1 Tax=Lepraria neglecta TaxID=209136 RepID=A0AAE0DLV9_9LECA|nr:hypothetical protein OEA41_001893 [Lepraria neglecta]
MHLTPSSLAIAFQPSPLALATLAIQEIMVGKVPGFTHSNYTDLGTDYLTSTFCYCTAPTHNESIKDEAHFFLIEYYNFNLNTTFILWHLSTAVQDDVHTCLSPRTEDGNLGRDDLFGWSGRRATFGPIDAAAKPEKAKACAQRIKPHPNRDKLRNKPQHNALSKIIPSSLTLAPI